MAHENDLPNGLIFKLPASNAPDFVKGKISIKRTEFISYLQDFNCEWLNFDLKISKAGKPYIVKDDWKPNSEDKPNWKSEENKQVEDDPSDLPF